MDSASLGPAALCVLDQHPYAMLGWMRETQVWLGRGLSFTQGPGTMVAPCS